MELNSKEFLDHYHDLLSEIDRLKRLHQDLLNLMNEIREHPDGISFSICNKTESMVFYSTDKLYKKMKEENDELIKSRDELMESKEFCYSRLAYLENKIIQDESQHKEDVAGYQVIVDKLGDEVKILQERMKTLENAEKVPKWLRDVFGYF